MQQALTIQAVDQAQFQFFSRDRPRIVCLCGSTRFWRIFQQAGLHETMAGRIVLSIGAASGTDDDHFGNLPQAEYDRIKTELDQLHFRKVELADEVLILNRDKYIGKSTSNELAHALKLGKPVRFWERPNRNTLDFLDAYGYLEDEYGYFIRE